MSDGEGTPKESEDGGEERIVTKGDRIRPATVGESIECASALRWKKHISAAGMQSQRSTNARNVTTLRLAYDTYARPAKKVEGTRERAWLVTLAMQV